MAAHDEQPSPSDDSHPINPAFLWLAVLIVWLAFALRITAILGLPQFVDENIHVLWAYSAMEGDIFTGLGDGRWLYILSLALLQPSGPESLWLARAISALTALVTVAAATRLGGLFAGKVAGRRATRQIGLFAALIYAVLPMAVFHERQAMVDSMLGMFLALVLLLTVRLARRPRLALAALLALSLAGANLTKASAAPFFVLPLVAVALLGRRRAIWRGLGLAALASGAALGITRLVVFLAVSSGTPIRPGHQPTFSAFLFSDPSNPALLPTLQTHLQQADQALLSYVGLPILVLAGLAAIWGVVGRAWREALLLMVPAYGFAAVPVLMEQVTGRGYLPPRYLLPNTLALVVLAACALVLLMDGLRRFGAGLAPAAGIVLSVGIMSCALSFDSTLIFNPARAPLAPVDNLQYFKPISKHDGFGMHAMAAALRDEWRASGRPMHLLGTGYEVWMMQVYLGPRAAASRELSDPPDGRIPRWLSDGEPVFLFASGRDARSRLHGIEGLSVEDVGSYGSLHLVRVVGVESALPPAPRLARLP